MAGLMALAFAPSAHAAPLQAGVATADITPENGGMTLGFVRPDIMVKGVHTRLMGRALVLDDGDTEVALLSTDLGYPLEKDSLVARVKDLGFTHETILYTGTHTHSGPMSLSDWQVEQLARAIRKAHEARVPGARGVGRRDACSTSTATGRSKRTSPTTGSTCSTGRAIRPTIRRAPSTRATPACGSSASTELTARRSRGGSTSPST